MLRTRFFKGVAGGVLFSACLWLFSPYIFAEEIKIVFTGQSYAMMFPCTCPTEPDGGVARRAALIKKIRGSSKNVIVVEAGNSFASGAQDQYAQNYETDSRRTDIYLTALKTMGYDAILIGGQEYVFGVDYLKRHEHDFPLLTSNIEGFSRPYVIKDLGGIKVGILGLTEPSAVPRGAQGWQSPAVALEEKVSDLKKKGVDLIVLLSTLPPPDDEGLIKSIKGIDIVINGSAQYGSVNLKEVGGALCVTTWWQAKKLGVLTLEVSKSKIIKKTLESPRLSSEIPDDESVLALLPQCFSDWDCKRMQGFASKCQEGATTEARCAYFKLSRVDVKIIEPRSCRTCRTEGVVRSLTKAFGDLKITRLPEDDPAAVALIKEFKMTMLPAYLLDKDVEKSDAFYAFSIFLDKGPNGYMVKPANAGVSYLLGSVKVPKRLDVFFDFEYKELPALFKLLQAFHAKHKDIDLKMNFLAVRGQNGGFLTREGRPEIIDEFERIACIEELEPGRVLDYSLCRSSAGVSANWETCASDSKIEVSKINACVSSAKGRELLAKRIKLTEDLRIASGPTFVIDNKEIFAIDAVPSLEEFEKVVLTDGQPTK